MMLQGSFMAIHVLTVLRCKDIDACALDYMYHWHRV